MAITINGSGTVSGITAGLTTAALPAGSIIQNTQTTNQTQELITTDKSFFSGSITPIKTSSHILIHAVLQIGAGSNFNGGICLKRDSTAINVAAAQVDSSVDAYWATDDFLNIFMILQILYEDYYQISVTLFYNHTYSGVGVRIFN